MAVTAYWLGKSLLNQFNSTANNRTNWASGGDAIKVMLLGVGYTEDRDNHDFLDDIVAQQLATAGGYTAGGYAEATRTLTYDATSNEVRLDAENALWSSATFTAYFAAVYNDTPSTNATKPVMGIVNFGGPAPVSAGTFEIQWDATGILKLTCN